MSEVVSLLGYNKHTNHNLQNVFYVPGVYKGTINITSNNFYTALILFAILYWRNGDSGYLGLKSRLLDPIAEDKQ